MFFTETMLFSSLVLFCFYSKTRCSKTTKKYNESIETPLLALITRGNQDLTVLITLELTIKVKRKYIITQLLSKL